MNMLERAQRLALNAMRRIAMLRAQSYKRVFFDADGGIDRDREIVLADLRDYCRATATTFSADPYSAARLAGRREAWLRIMQHLTLDEARVRKLVEIDDGMGDE